MSVRRGLIAVALACGLCVWAFARSGDTPLAAHTGDPLAPEAADEDEEVRDEAAARFRTNQPRHWRYVAVGHSHSH